MRSYEEFPLNEFREAASGDGAAGDRFFRKFDYAEGLKHGNYAEVISSGLDLLDFCKSKDKVAYDRIHKGTPFYWLGTAAFMVNDYETAAYFYDAAVSEDFKAGARIGSSPTPALRFVTLDNVSDRHAAKGLVDLTVRKIEKSILLYARMSGCNPFSVSDLKSKFLIPATEKQEWRSLATAFVSFFLEWGYRIRMIGLRTDVGTNEPFFMHLFKGCVLFESLLKVNPTCPVEGDTLGRMLKINKKKQPPIPTPLAEKIGFSPVDGGRATFGGILQGLSGYDNTIQQTHELTYNIRNTVGHNLSWTENLNAEDYNKLVEIVAASCLHAIACLY